MLADANLKNQPETMTFDELNQTMKNLGKQQFDYRTFKAAYDSDERIQNMVANFNKEGLALNTDVEADEDPQAPQQDIDGDEEVSQMAKRATRARQ
jgi:ribosomal protein L29